MDCMYKNIPRKLPTRAASDIRVWKIKSNMTEFENPETFAGSQFVLKNLHTIPESRQIQTLEWHSAFLNMKVIKLSCYLTAHQQINS